MVRCVGCLKDLYPFDMFSDECIKVGQAYYCTKECRENQHKAHDARVEKSRKDFEKIMGRYIPKTA
jgi:hypothetical protein